MRSMDPPPPIDEEDRAPDPEAARTSPLSSRWLPYYELAESAARAREAEWARRKHSATNVWRMLTIGALAVVALGYALWR
jgi:hypothetical protein